MVYLNHRRFLPLNDPLRKARAGFPSKRKPPPLPSMKNQDYIDKSNKKYDNSKSKNEKKRIATQTGCKGNYALRRLPGHNRFLNTPPEPMHLIKNIVEHIVCLLSGLEDSRKVREEERERGRFPETWVEKGASVLPDAPFRLTTNEMVIASERSCAIQVPSSVEWRPRPIFGKKCYTGMTSHQWKELVSTHILKYTLRGLLGKKQRETLFFFFDTLSTVCEEAVNMNSLKLLEYNIHKALSLLERDFPVSLHVSVFHLLHHVPTYLAHFGPVYSHWMYPYERFNSWLIRRVHNRRYPEATVLDTFRLLQWAHSLVLMGQLHEEALFEVQSEVINTPTIQIYLTETDIINLRKVYQNLFPVFNALCERYNVEKLKARKEHRLRRFPDMCNWIPTSGPQLTEAEVELQGAISSGALRLPRFIKTNQFGQKITFTSIYSDTEKVKSSYVFLRRSDSLCLFGRIKLLFTHTFYNTTTTFACINWYGSPQIDAESGLPYVLLENNESSNPIVPAISLSGPIVTAIDHDRLWILSPVHM